MKSKRIGGKATVKKVAPKTDKELSREKLEKALLDMTVPEKRVAMDKWLNEWGG